MDMRPPTLTPTEFERLVTRILEEEGVGLAEFRATHQDKIVASDGTYKFDATARFEALGASFLVLVECKHQRRPIEREVLEVLHDKLGSVGAHKGMVFSTSPFQRGAVTYARKHGIALVQFVDGRTIYRAKALDIELDYPEWVPEHVGQLVSETDEGNLSYSYLGALGPPEWHPATRGYLMEYLRADHGCDE
jgi:restriction system protein